MRVVVLNIAIVISVVSIIFTPCCPLYGKDGGDSVSADVEAVDTALVLDCLSLYYDDLLVISKLVSCTSSLDSLQLLDKSVKRVELKWSGYYAANAAVIGESDDLINVTVEWQTLMKQLTDTMVYKQGLAVAWQDYGRVSNNLIAQDSLYDEMVDKAVSLSLVKSMAKQLDLLKSDEQVAIEGVNSGYGSLKQLSEQYVELKTKMDTLDRLYVEIKRRSELIQSQVYKPLFERVKEYLIGLAAVAMILMFFNVAYSKFKELKGAGKKLKELKKMMGGEDQYPTI